MAVPPPQDDDSGPEAITFGIAAVDAALDEAEVEFPADRVELRKAIGDVEIAYDTRGRSIPCAEALAQTEMDRFETRRELLNALHPVFEAKRGSGGVVAWLRSVFPF